MFSLATELQWRVVFVVWEVLLPLLPLLLQSFLLSAQIVEHVPSLSLISFGEDAMLSLTMKKFYIHIACTIRQ